MLYLSLEDTRRLDLRMAEVVPVVEQAFRLVGEGRAVAVPRVRLVHPALAQGELGQGRPWERDLRIIPGALEGVGFAVRLGGSLRRRAGGVLLALFDWQDLSLLALISDHLVHAVRSTAPDGVLAQHLALPEAAVLGLIGSGRLARWATEAVAAVRPIREVRVWSPTPEHVAECVAYLRGHAAGGYVVESAASAEAAVREAQVVVSATNAPAPVLRGEWLANGCTVITNTPEELDRSTLLRGRLVSTYREGILTHVPPYQSLVELLEAGALPAGALDSELDEVVSGRRAGRVDPDEVIVCLNPAFGVIDAAVARFVHDRARALGIGTELSP